MDDLRLGSKLIQSSRNPIIESSANGDDEIRVHDGIVSILCSVHPEHP